MSKFLYYHNRILKGATFILYLVFILLGFGQIIWRYVLNQPVTWVEQLSRYLFIWSVFLGAALVVGTGEHIALSFFIDRLPSKIHRYLMLFNNLIIIVLISWLYVFDGFRILKVVSTQIAPAMGIRMTMTVPYLSIAVGGLLMLVNLLCRTCAQRESVRSNSGTEK